MNNYNNDIPICFCLIIFLKFDVEPQPLNKKKRPKEKIQGRNN